jgi:hypothetical protein
MWTLINPFQISELRLIECGRPVVHVHVAGQHRFTINILKEGEEPVDQGEVRHRRGLIARHIMKKMQGHNWVSFGTDPIDYYQFTVHS